MIKSAINRREFFETSGAAAFGVSSLGVPALDTQLELPKITVVRSQAGVFCVTWGEDMLDKQIREKFGRSFMGCKKAMFAEDWEKAQKAFEESVRIFTVDEDTFRRFQQLQLPTSRDDLLKRCLKEQYKEEVVRLDSNQVERRKRRQELHRAIFKTDLLFL